ncbi:MAG: phosphate/phosphite/phosphonate ABC transporter substrate-binding protein [Thiogranum sp.]|nr:phosphate/phosphite/phosphonate ABC transporter substrate-binding protein [Thiogranum sp.]
MISDRRLRALRLLIVALLAGTPIGSVQAAGDGNEVRQVYRFGVFPHLPPSRLEQVYLPVALDFRRALGRDIEFRASGSFARFSERLAAEAYDIVLLQPFDYVWAHDQHGYLPVARRSEELTSIIIVKNDSAIQSLDDLRGKVLANPPETAAVSFLTRQAVLAAGLHPGRDVTLRYVRSHYSCLQKVLIGKADACGTARQSMRLAEPQLKNGFRIIYETPPIPQVLFAVHERVPKRNRERIRDAVLGWARSREGQKILAQGSMSPFVPATDDEYDDVRYIRHQEED